MALSVFGDKARSPSEAEVASCLGEAAALWDRIRQDVAARIPGVTAKWGYSCASTGWGLRLQEGARVVLYLTPQNGAFLASLALGEKAVSAANAKRLPAAVRRLVNSAPRFVEGRGVRLLVTKPSDVRTVAALVALKLDT
jgi:hypothetical protein